MHEIAKYGLSNMKLSMVDPLRGYDMPNFMMNDQMW